MSEELENKDPVQTNGVPQAEQKGLSIASMVLGIISLVLFCLWYVSIPCAILAIIFAVIGRKKGGKGMATAGLVTGIIAISLLLVGFISAAAMGNALFKGSSSILGSYYY